MSDIYATADKLFKRMVQVKTDDETRGVFLKKSGHPTELAFKSAVALGTRRKMFQVVHILENKLEILREVDYEAFQRMSSDIRELDMAWNGINGWQG